MLETSIIQMSTFLKHKTTPRSKYHARYFKRKPCIDVIVPSYRCNIEFLSQIVSINVPSHIETTFIIVIDNPKFKITNEFKDQLFGCIKNESNVNLRIHQHSSNLGASAARNTGINSADAEYLIFLDDDIKPSKNLIVKYVDAIINNPNAKMFIGNTVLPMDIDTDNYNIWQQALKKSVAYFYDISTKMDHPPWGVTANIMLKIGRIEGIHFDTSYRKNGGGEDIDICTQLVDIKHLNRDSISVTT